MAIDPRHLLSRRFEPRRHAYTVRDTALYALGVGLAADPLDDDELPFVYEGVDGRGMRALPKNPSGKLLKRELRLAHQGLFGA